MELLRRGALSYSYLHIYAAKVAESSFDIGRGATHRILISSCNGTFNNMFFCSEVAGIGFAVRLEEKYVDVEDRKHTRKDKSYPINNFWVAHLEVHLIQSRCE